MDITGSANGKLLLFGEHAAVHGFPAVGLSLPVKTEIHIQFTGIKHWDFSLIKKEYRKSLDILIQGMFDTYPVYQTDKQGIIKINSEIQPGRGFGSSAALCVALLRCFESLINKKSDPMQLWERAHMLEHQFHGKPSGIDTGLSVFDDLHAFYPHLPGLPGHEKLNFSPLCLVAGNIPRCGNTRDLVLKIGRQLSDGDVFVKNSLGELGEISRQAIDVFHSAGTDVPEKIGGLANRAHDILKGLGLSTDSMDALLSAGRDAGAAGGKLSGAGGGGAFYLVAQNKSHAQKIVTSVVNACPVSAKLKDNIYIFEL